MIDLKYFFVITYNSLIGPQVEGPTPSQGLRVMVSVIENKYIFLNTFH